MSNYSRNGFTLVELLLVIVVMGILSAMMMFSSTEAITTAKVNNIINNLRHIKSAALDMFTDYYNFFSQTDETGYPKNGPEMTKIQQAKGNPPYNVRPVVSYMSKGGSDLPDIGDYDIAVGGDETTNKGSWYVIYEIKGTNAEIVKIKNKLAGRAASLGLLGTSKKNIAPDNNTEKYTNQACVALKIR